MLEIKSDRTHRAEEKKKKRGIMGVFLLLPSLLSTVISHHSTPSLWIPSSLRQFHSPLSLSLSLNLLPHSLGFSCGAPNSHYSFPASWAEPTAFLRRCNMTSTHPLPPSSRQRCGDVVRVLIIFGNTTWRSQTAHANTDFYKVTSEHVTFSQRPTGWRGGGWTRLLSITCLQATRTGSPDHN